MSKGEFGEQMAAKIMCELTSLDYFLWGNVKKLVYVDRSTTIEA